MSTACTHCRAKYLTEGEVGYGLDAVCTNRDIRDSDNAIDATEKEHEMREIKDWNGFSNQVKSKV